MTADCCAEGTLKQNPKIRLKTKRTQIAQRQLLERTASSAFAFIMSELLSELSMLKMFSVSYTTNPLMQTHLATPTLCVQR